MNPEFRKILDRIKLALSYYNARVRVEGTVDAYYITGETDPTKLNPELYGIRIKMEFEGEYTVRNGYTDPNAHRLPLTLSRHIVIPEAIILDRVYQDYKVLELLHGISVEILKKVNHV